MTLPLAECKILFESKNSFVLTTHVNPDGDGLGSEVALALFLQSKGKRVSIINQSATPAYYRFLNSVFPIETYAPETHNAEIAQCEVFVALDTNSPKRFPSLAGPLAASRSYKLCIDHHLDREPFADLYVVDESATATGEILYRLLTFMDPAPLSREIAEALYAAIMTDTGSFRFPKTDAETHRITASLLERGADPTGVYQKIFEEGSANRLQLLGRALKSLGISHGGSVASIALRRTDFAETGTAEEDTDNMINYTLTIGGVVIGLMFTELSDCVKVSFRSKGEIPINELAKEFGGNGHLNAAGARVTGAFFEEVVTRVTSRAGYYAHQRRDHGSPK